MSRKIRRVQGREFIISGGDKGAVVATAAERGLKGRDQREFCEGAVEGYRQRLTDQAQKTSIEDERVRIRSIILAPEAEGREDAAKHLALHSDMSVKEARELLAELPDKVDPRSMLMRSRNNVPGDEDDVARAILNAGGAGSNPDADDDLIGIASGKRNHS